MTSVVSISRSHFSFLGSVFMGTIICGAGDLIIQKNQFNGELKSKVFY